MKHRQLPALSLAVATLACLLGCGSEPVAPSAVVIVIDTLRADRVGAQRTAGALTPGLSDFAEGAVTFEQAFSHAPWTLPACASILSGRHPLEHGAGGQLGSFRTMDPSVQTLPEVFKARGYRTHAIVNVVFLAEDFGVTRGFDSVDAEFFNSNVELRPAGPTTDAALKWIEENKDEPFLLFVHYFDPHAVYDPPQPFRRRFAAQQDKEDESFVFGTRSQMMSLRKGELAIGPKVIQRAEQLYDAEVAYTDAEVERLIDGIDAKLPGGETIIVVTGDHGEEFLDHGGFEHGHTVYDELCHIPLMIRAPGLAPARVQQAVRHVDLAPTLFQLCDLPQPEEFVGQSLVGLAAGEPLPERPVLAHGNMWGEPLTSFRDGGFKLIFDKSSSPELYNWRQDPGEQQDLAAQKPAEVERLQAALRAWAGHMEALKRGEEADLTAAQQEMLRTLGYIGEDEDPLDESGK